MRLPVAIDTPCGAKWDEMSAQGARARLCSSCDKVVHDLSGRSDDEVDALLADGPVCVRYLYDVHGNRLLEAPAAARVVPAEKLLSKVARSRWARAAALAGAAIVFEACGGNDGGRSRMPVPEYMPQTNDVDAGVAVDPDAGADAAR